MTVLDQERYLASLPFPGENMKEAKIVKDIPVGVLILVLSQFVFYGVIYLAKHPPFWELAGIVFLTLVSSDMVHFGIRLIRGYENDTSE
jgi:hypothetical protein